jgi:hypothetical protein
MPSEVAQEREIEEMVPLHVLLSGSAHRRNLITETVKQHQAYELLQRLCERLQR